MKDRLDRLTALRHTQKATQAKNVASTERERDRQRMQEGEDADIKMVGQIKIHSSMSGMSIII